MPPLEICRRGPGTCGPCVNTALSALHEDQYIFITTCSVLLRMRNVSNKIVEKINTHILCSVNFFIKKSCRLWDVEKSGRASLATDDNTSTIQRMRIANYRRTLSEYVILIAFHCNSGCTTSPPYYVIRMLSVLLSNIYVASCVQKFTL
jgi:hypothetical protein